MFQTKNKWVKHLTKCTGLLAVNNNKINIESLTKGVSYPTSSEELREGQSLEGHFLIRITKLEGAAITIE